MKQIKKIYYAMFQLKKYPQMLGDSAWSAFLHGFILLFLFYGILLSSFGLEFRQTYGSLQALAERSIPEFTLEHGKMDVKGQWSYAQSGIYMDVNTQSPGAFSQLDEKDIERIQEENSSVWIMDADRLLLSDAVQRIDLRFADYREARLDKNDLLKYLPTIRLVLILSMVIAFFMLLAFYFFILIFLALIARVYAFFTRRRIEFSTAYKLAIYASTLPIVLLLIYSLLPISIPFFSYLNFYIFLFIMHKVISRIQPNIMTFAIKNEEDLQNLMEKLREDTRKHNVPEEEIERQLSKFPSFAEVTEMMQEEEGQQEKDDYRRIQPDVIVPSSGWSLGEKKEE